MILGQSNHSLPIIFILKSLKRLVMIQMFSVQYTISWMEVFQIDL